ncbi:MAG: type II toxin-antitoxin system prevent-host-death family antitoxin [Candidatus Dormibacteraeota bacterium]|nr:type II toxin-antitoxin system prevent-host-death family antitoxin [Candidatus Dormibacteraeota bacterium]
MLREPGDGTRKGAPPAETAGAIPATARLPVLGEVPAEVWEAVREGQPVLLTLHGVPAAVVVDLGSWAEVEELLQEEVARAGEGSASEGGCGPRGLDEAEGWSSRGRGPEFPGDGNEARGLRGSGVEFTHA